MTARSAVNMVVEIIFVKRVWLSKERGGDEVVEESDEVDYNKALADGWTCQLAYDTTLNRSETTASIYTDRFTMSTELLYTVASCNRSKPFGLAGCTVDSEQQNNLRRARQLSSKY